MSATRERTKSFQEKVKALLEECKCACDRPVFEEIVKHQEILGGQKRQKVASEDTSKPERWEALLADASKLAPFMTRDEHATMSRIAAIFLLGFLIPTSTGYKSFTLKIALPNEFVDMDLEERLENSIRYYSSNEYGQIDVCVDVSRERVFHSFLSNGLFPFLASSPAHSKQTDLLHLIAMIISPRPQAMGVIGDLVDTFESKQVPAWLKAKRLMKSPFPSMFQVHNGHRKLLVGACCNYVVIPETESAEMLAGAVPHMLASLWSFAARSVEDAHFSHKAMVTVAIQTGQEGFVQEVFESLLMRTMEDRSPCTCPDFCPHASRGSLMADCITRFNASRHYADGEFTVKMTQLLTMAIEQEVQPWLESSHEPACSSCLLSHLLLTARPLFYFLLQDDDRKRLVELAIQLLGHPEVNVCKNASDLLFLALTYCSQKDRDEYSGQIVRVLKRTLGSVIKHQTGRKVIKIVMALEKITVVCCRLSSSSARALLSFVLEGQKETWKRQNDGENSVVIEAVAYLVATIIGGNPQVGLQYNERVLEMARDCAVGSARRDLTRALLTMRQAYFFVNECRNVHVVIEKLAVEEKDSWWLYTIARHAMATGNFGSAETIYEQLLQLPTTETSFLWLSCLHKLAQTEQIMVECGASGLPQSLAQLHSSLSHLRALSRRSSTGQSKMLFQVGFLQLRLDFLDLAAATRSLVQEVRISGIMPKETTRTGLHLTNSFKLWRVLAYRYRKLYRQFGLFFCQQSKTSMRAIYTICMKISTIGIKLFEGRFKNIDQSSQDLHSPRGDQTIPSVRLLNRLERVVLDRIDKSVEPSTRATAFTEILEGVLLSAFPFPRGYTVIKPERLVQFRVSTNDSTPMQPPSEDIGSFEEAGCWSVYPGLPFTLIATGHIPNRVKEQVSLPFSQLLLWHSIDFVAPLHAGLEAQTDQGDMAESEFVPLSQPRQKANMAEVRPIEISLASCSNFVVPVEIGGVESEGVYRVSFVLGCRDVRCGEWELPVANENSSLHVRVTRSLPA